MCVSLRADPDDRTPTIGMNLGPVDPQTGAQSIVTRFKIDENWVLIGTTGIEGGVQGKVKYLVRFR